MLNNREIHLLVDDTIYNSEILHKCFYWYSDQFIVDITHVKIKSKYEIKLLSNIEMTEQEKGDKERQINRDLIDYKLRDIVSAETKTIRELIIAKAFAYYDVDENPITSVSDPVGFNPKII